LFFLLFPAEIAEMAEIHFSDWNHAVVKPIQRIVARGCMKYYENVFSINFK
jgi:hypothetical protein